MDSLSDYLENNLVPEQYDLFKACILTVHQLGLESITTNLDDLRHVDLPTLNIIEEMRYLLETTMTSILSEWGIRLSEETPPSLHEILALIKTVQDTENTDDRESVLAILSAEDDAFETFANLMEFFGFGKWSLVYGKVADIQIELIQSMHRLLTPRAPIETNDYTPDAPEWVIERTQRFFEQNEKQGVIWDWITSTSTITVGFDANEMLDIVDESLASLTNAKQAAKELVAYLTASSTENANILTEVGRKAEVIWEDLAFIMSVIDHAKEFINV